MKACTVAFFLTFIHQAGAANGCPDETVLYGTLGEGIVLPCCNAAINVTSTLAKWMKNGQLIIDSNHSKITNFSEGHLTLLKNQSLYINVLARSDQGNYTCVSFPNDTKNRSVHLHINNAAGKGSIVMEPAGSLPNGTLFVQRGSRLVLNCFGLFNHSQTLSWGFQGVSSTNKSFAVGNGPWLNISIEDIQPKDQGNYSCSVQNSVSEAAVVGRKELLVYYPPERNPECMWRLGEDPTNVQFNCSWFGGYPSPTLLWGESHIVPGSLVTGQLMEEEETVSLVVNLNRSSLLEEENLRCYGHHPTIGPEDKFCSFTLMSPYPSGNPMVTALEGTNVTLTCSEEVSLPPAITTWQKIHQEDVIPSAKYVMSENGPVYSLTIVNVTKEDEGFYFCRSENPLSVRALEIQLTVKDSLQYTGAVIGVFLAVLVIGSGVVIGKILYSRRDRICLGNGFGRMEEETGDVISLVDSDEDLVFEEAVPKLPPQPVANGHSTTFVQIHRIPSNDHEDTGIVQHPLQLEHTTDMEELVTF